LGGVFSRAAVSSNFKRHILRQTITFILVLIFFGCQPSDTTDNSDQSNASDSSNLTNSNKIDSVSSFQHSIFFDTTITTEEFIKEVEEYSKKVVNNVPPKPCEEYILRAIIGFRHFPIESDSSLYKYSLCEDIIKFEALQKEYEKKSSEGVATYGCWHFTFRPVGEKYFIIEGVEVISSISEVTYYYERKD
jgi:hypothetical protein